MFQNPLSESKVPNNLLQFQTLITCDYFHEILNEELILVNDENTQHTFYYNYPSNPYIHAIRKFGGKNYSQSYKIISLGQYPTKVIYTRKEKGINYKVLNNYQVETTLSGLTVLYKTQYQFSRKIAIKYIIEWTDENDQIKSRYSLSSAEVADSLFLKEIAAQTLTILKNNKFTSPSEEIIVTIEAIVLKINGEIVELHFYSNNITDFTQHLDSIIRACDETLISRDSYRRLAKAIPNLIREYIIEKRRNEITNIMNALIPIKLFNIYNFLLTTLTSPVLKVGNKINIKLSGDGRNVGRKQKHVMLIMCILNEEEAVLNPAHQYSICLYIGKESYDFLSIVSIKFSHELEKLKTNRYKDSNNTIWPVELFFLGDWKFVALVMGINAATSNYFCLYCNCHKDERYNMDKVWLNSKNMCGYKNMMLFQEIDQSNWITDELHLMLRISDTSLMGPNKKKILKDFQVKHLFEGQQAIRGQNIEHLWPCASIYAISKTKGMVLQHFSTSSIEKKNHQQ
ncbi:15657_t:CDS:2, partial [Funneliformis mosseae]